MKKSGKKNYVVIALVVLLLALAIGYASFSTVLTINGTATGTFSWDVKFTSAKFLDAEGTEVDAEKAAASISTKTKTNDTITATVKNLAYPGDGVILEAVITNAGSQDAKLSEFTIDPATDDDLEVTVASTFDKTNEIIEAGKSCTVQFLVKWKTTSTSTSLDKTFTIDFKYSQDTTEFTGTPQHKTHVENT